MYSKSQCERPRGVVVNQRGHERGFVEARPPEVWAAQPLGVVGRPEEDFGAVVEHRVQLAAVERLHDGRLRDVHERPQERVLEHGEGGRDEHADAAGGLRERFEDAGARFA